MRRNHHCTNRKFLSLAGAIMAAFALWGLPSQLLLADSTWTGGGDGASWSDAGNWDSGVPMNGYANIGDTAVDRTIIMDVVGNRSAVNWTQTSDAVNKIQVDEDWVHCCYNANFLWDNTSGDPANMVWDLNGSHIETNDGGTFSLRNVSIAGPGIWSSTRKIDFGPGATVGAGVTVRKNFAAINLSNAGNEPWDPSSTLEHNTSAATYTGNGTLGNLTVSQGVFVYNGSYTVGGDFTISETGEMEMVGGRASRLFLKGNFTDLNQNGYHYSSPPFSPPNSNSNGGSLHFIGDGSTVQQIDIRHPLNAQFRMGNEFFTPRVELANDYDAGLSSLPAGIAYVPNPHESALYSGTLDLNGYDLTIGDLAIVGGVNLVMDASGDEATTSTINANLLGTIQSFNVEIVDAGGWNSGDDFVLLNYAGIREIGGHPVPNYTPELGSLLLPSGWQYDGFADENNQLKIKNLRTSGGTVVPPGDDFVWNVAGGAGGEWNTSANWSPSTVPSTNDHVVTFDSSSSGGTIAVTGPVTVNKISFDSASDSFTVTGPEVISLQASTELVDPSISVVAGSHTISADIHQVDGVTVGVADGASLTVGAVNLDGGTMQKHGAGELRIDGTAAGSVGNLVANAGTISGSGTVGGDFINVAGNVAPGSSAGILTVGGSYTQGEDATLSIELGGTTAGDEYDRLVVGGMASLDGTLNVSLIDGFTLAGSLGFDVLDASQVNGDFATLNLPAGLTWNASDGTLSFGSGGGLPGDFNGNGTVDAADYVVWSDNRGAGDESALGGNGNGTGGVDQADYLLWKNNFGNTSGSGNSAAIPEPAALSLLLVAVLGALARCRHSRAALVG